jgi:hypothetical protein
MLRDGHLPPRQSFRGSLFRPTSLFPETGPSHPPPEIRRLRAVDEECAIGTLLWVCVGHARSKELSAGRRWSGKTELLRGTA